MKKVRMANFLDARLDLTISRPEPPKYSRLRSSLMAEISAGHLAPGEALPTEIDLARNYGVGRNTVRQALAEMEREGFVRRIRGKGTFVQDQNGQGSPAVQHDRDCLALVMNDTKDPAHVSLLQGFEAAGRGFQLHTLVRSTENNIDKQGNVLFHLLDYGLLGLALVPSTDQATPTFQIRQLQEHGIPVVFCHRGVNGCRAPLIPIPFYDVGRMAGEAFIKYGHRRAASFCPDPAEPYRSYQDGLRDAMRAGGGDLLDEHIFIGESHTGDVRTQEKAVTDAIKLMCRGSSRPTAIFASCDPLAELIYLVLGRMEMKIPDDISLLSEGGPYRQGAITSRLTSVVIQEGEMGQRAVELIQEMRNGKRSIYDDEVIVIPVQLIEGRTLGPAPRELHRIEH